ncbi:MAG: hypothetical protein OM95_00550 [Bdellovibrio sp. ArHS]|uniref:hypothetical protein n=1 Tax=Bdellovibrio sp. ArHS TaxID=1569284 RepID=UPI000583B06F|nr:hypothetical protein [Bdellovibrio sp. ArHS]KHD90044.1 MAG: hypothetical protein OM95_00550 [Bdellovibrio sp. ArHS]
MSLISALTMTCLVYGPAETSENLNLYKILQPLQISEGTLRTTSLNQNSEVEHLEFKIIQDNSEACPGAVVAKDRKGHLAALKGLYTGPAGYTKGALLFEDKDGVVFRALIACPEVTLNPTCETTWEPVEGWEVL